MTSRQRLPKPKWLKVRAPGGERYTKIKGRARQLKLATVCEEAQCPNIGECWGSGTATFMVMGEVCTRGCRFCAVTTRKNGVPLDPEEPTNVATAIAEMELDYVVLTSVDRDDVPDGGASHFAACIREIRKASPKTMVEVLIPDFQGDMEHLALVVAERPDVIAHNVECVPRLDKTVRDHRASFDQSLGILREARRLRPDLLIKTSIMVGLGESDEELEEAMALVRDAGVDLITLGQYLAPSSKHLPADRFPEPERYEEWADHAMDLGFLGVASGPLVRSSFKAGLLLRACTEENWQGSMPGATVRVRPGAAADRHPHRRTSGGEA